MNLSMPSRLVRVACLNAPRFRPSMATSLPQPSLP
jgi:hypothetical protein